MASSNVNRDNLHKYARKVATYFGLPDNAPFVDGSSSAQIFDFSSRSACKTPAKLLEKGGKQLLVYAIGDALIEPFWPEGLGVNRGFLSVLDAAYVVQEYFSTGACAPENVKKMLKTTDRLFNMMKVLSGHTKKDTLREQVSLFSLDPNSRYVKWKTGWD